MKTLKEYILESSKSVSSTFVFNFKDMPDSAETIEDLINKCNSANINCVQSDEKLSITLNQEMVSNSNVIEIVNNITSISDKYRKDTKNASNESFAQKTKAFKETAENMQSFIEMSKEEKEETEESQDKIDDNNKKENN